MSAPTTTVVGQSPAAVPLQTRTVTLSRVVTHPANPRKDLGDLTELEDSIRELGVLQPPVVLPAPRVAAAWPEHAQDLADADWVVLMGARRRTAAGTVAADPHSPFTVLVREDPIADDPLAQLDVMTAENVARKALTAVEEARAFSAQVAAGRRQHEVATRMGCSQGHVSKRLKLLRLPAPLLNTVEAGELEIGDAMEFVDAAGDDQEVILAAHALRDNPNRRHWCKHIQLGVDLALFCLPALVALVLFWSGRPHQPVLLAVSLVEALLVAGFGWQTVAYADLTRHHPAAGPGPAVGAQTTAGQR